MHTRNYQPHNKWARVRQFVSNDVYLERLSIEVNAACNRFFANRGMVINYQFKNTSWFNAKQATKA
jgi:hypothetical protein